MEKNNIDVMRLWNEYQTKGITLDQLKCCLKELEKEYGKVDDVEETSYQAIISKYEVRGGIAGGKT